MHASQEGDEDFEIEDGTADEEEDPDNSDEFVDDLVEDLSAAGRPSSSKKVKGAVKFEASRQPWTDEENLVLYAHVAVRGKVRTCPVALVRRRPLHSTNVYLPLAVVSSLLPPTHPNQPNNSRTQAQFWLDAADRLRGRSTKKCAEQWAKKLSKNWRPERWIPKEGWKA